MNRRGMGGDNIAAWYVAYFVLLVLFFVGALYYVTWLQDGAALWEDVYAKEIVRVIERAQPQEEVTLDIQVLTELTVAHGGDLRGIVRFDNVLHTVSVSTRPGLGTTYGYFNDVQVIDDRIETPGAEGKNVVRFVVTKRSAA
jgi:hypothetical protein